MEKRLYSLDIYLAIVCRMTILFTLEVEFEWSGLDFGYFPWAIQGDAHFLPPASDMVPFAAFLIMSHSNFIN